MHYIRFFVVIIGVLILKYGVAQAPKFESFKILKNISSIQVNTIEQDQQGFIWLGTDNGLIKYDGVDFIQFEQEDGLDNNFISSLAFDPFNNTLWIGHSNGKISTLNEKGISKFNPEEGLSSKEISSILIDNCGTMWFSTLNEGIYYYLGTTRKRLYNLNTDDGLLDNYVYSISQYHDFLWIGMNDLGICMYDIELKKFSHVADWEFGTLNNMVLSANNDVYVSTGKHGIVKLQYDENKQAWYSNYRKNNGINDVRTKIVFLDRENNLWVGTKKGLSLRKNNNIEFFDANSGFNLTQIFSISTDQENRFWIACQSGLYLHYRDKMGQLTTKKMLDKPEFNLALFISVTTDYNGNIWAGTYGFGAFCINPKTFEYKKYNTNNGLVSNDVFNIVGDSANIWLATAGGGVSRINLNDYKTISNFSTSNGLSSNYVFSLYLENPEKAWVATDGGGISIIENNQIHKYQNNFIDSLSSKIYSISPDVNGNLWVNIAEHGVLSLNNENNPIHIHELNGLSSSNLQSIMGTCNNQLITASNQGIDIIDIKTLQTEQFGEESGLGNLEPNLNAIYVDKSNNIYIGTATGMIKIQNHKNDTLVKPHILITNKRLFLNEIENKKGVFSHKQNNFSFTYTGLWFKSQKPLTYRYKLEGYDMDWSPESTIRTITYPKLPDGKYRFIVQAKLSNGIWIDTQDSQYTFRIRPPFWKTPIFIIFTILFGVISIYLFVNHRTRKLKEDKDNLEKEVVKRTAEIRQQKEEIESQRDEIEAQRNFVIEQRDKIEAQNNDITASIQYASRIQRAVLPPEENFLDYLNEYFIFFKPRDIVSGDFYYLNKKDGRVIIAAADCTGHGVPGAFMSLLGVALLNEIVLQLPSNYNAAHILNSLREGIKRALRQTGKKDEAKDGMDISLCVIDLKNKYLDYAGAFNPLLVIRNKEVIIYKANKMPIGVFLSEEDEFTNHKVELQENDMLYLYSDGFQDQFGGPKVRKFLPKQLRNLLIEISHLPMVAQNQSLDKTFMEWKGNQHQIDDVLVIGIRI